MSSNAHAQARNTKHILLNNLGSKQSDNEIWPVYAILENKFFFVKKLYEKCGLKTSSRPFMVFKEPSAKKDSVEVTMLFWTNFDSFAVSYLI